MVKIFKASKKQSNLKAKHVITTIEKLDHECTGIARIHNKVTFVEAALPGEECKVKIEQVQSKINRASIVEVIKPHNDRVAAECEYFGRCGGCQLQHIASNQQLKYKQQAFKQQLEDFAALAPKQWAPPLSDSHWHYRRKARLACFYNKKNQQLSLGFKEKRSNNLCAVSHCQVIDKRASELLPALEEVLNQTALKKHLGHVTLLAEEKITVVLRHTQNLTKADSEILVSFAQGHHIQLISQPEKLQFNPVYPDDFSLEYKLEGEISIAYQPDDFIQINSAMNQKMVQQAIDWLQPQKTQKVLDLYSGLGNFTLPLAKLTKHVTGVEGVIEMVRKARNNAQLNQLDNVVFEQADLDELSRQNWLNQEFDILLLDPARAGAKTLCENIARFKAKKILYVSCSPATFIRDAKQLVQQGYDFSQVGVMEMFPQTKHLECMGLFSLK